MDKITLDQIKAIEIPEAKPITVSCGDLEVEVKTSLTDFEQKLFVDTVVEKSFIGLDYCPVMNDLIKTFMFAKLFTNIDIPDSVDDISDICAKLDSINLIANAMDNKDISDLIVKLESYIYEKLEFEREKICAMYASSSANTEAIENTNEMLIKFGNLIDKLADFVEVNGKKISKKLTPKRIEKGLADFQEKVLKVITEKLSKDAPIQEDSNKKVENPELENQLTFVDNE